MTCGALYIITQNPKYSDLLLGSAASLKRVMPELPITVFSQFPVQSSLFDRVTQIESTEQGFYDKVRFMLESPYERTLFIDADTHVLTPVPELLSLLDRFDCAATHEEYVNTDWFNRYPRPDIPQSFPEFNTGVFLFRRSEAMRRVLQHWADLYASYLKGKPEDPINDQPFFRVAAYDGDIRIATLPREYNCKFRGQGYLNGSVKILHGHVDFQLRTELVSKAARALNASVRPRVYIAGKVIEQKIVGRLVGKRTAHRVATFSDPPGSLLRLRVRRLKQVLKQRGLGGTVARIFEPKRMSA